MTEPAQTPVDAPAPPSTTAEAATRLDQLKQDSAWRDGFLKGGPAQMREYGDLQALVRRVPWANRDVLQRRFELLGHAKPGPLQIRRQHFNFHRLQRRPGDQ
jgi:hypothetical protein